MSFGCGAHVVVLVLDSVVVVDYVRVFAVECVVVVVVYSVVLASSTSADGNSAVVATFGALLVVVMLDDVEVVGPLVRAICGAAGEVMAKGACRAVARWIGRDVLNAPPPETSTTMQFAANARSAEHVVTALRLRSFVRCASISARSAAATRT